jgi:hypothetical protein
VKKGGTATGSDKAAAQDISTEKPPQAQKSQDTKQPANAKYVVKQKDQQSQQQNNSN